MVETTVKQRAFSFIVSEDSSMNWETQRYF